MRIARSECLSGHKRLLSGGDDAARSRTQGRGGQSREQKFAEKRAEVSIFHPPKKRRTHDFTKIMCPEVQGTLPCREIFKRQGAS